jgi:hypothetical protein
MYFTTCVVVAVVLASGAPLERVTGAAALLCGNSTSHTFMKLKILIETYDGVLRDSGRPMMVL